LNDKIIYNSSTKSHYRIRLRCKIKPKRSMRKLYKTKFLWLKTNGAIEEITMEEAKDLIFKYKKMHKYPLIIVYRGSEICFCKENPVCLKTNKLKEILEKLSIGKTKVNCEKWRCKYNDNGVCSLDEINLVESYGRSTDYVHEFMCENEE